MPKNTPVWRIILHCAQRRPGAQPFDADSARYWIKLDVGWWFDVRAVVNGLNALRRRGLAEYIPENNAGLNQYRPGLWKLTKEGMDHA